MAILKHVMAPFERVSHKALTAKLTKISEEFDPVAANFKGRPPKESGKVTMGLFLDHECLVEDLQTKLINWDDYEAFVNPWEQDSLRYMPVACFFETSATQPERDSVANWGAEMGRQVAALHNRLNDFLDAKYSDLNKPLEEDSDVDFSDEWTEAHQKDSRHKDRLGSDRPFDDCEEPWERPLIAALPQFCVRGHDWYLYFACDGGDHVDLLDGLWIGSTRDLPDIYFLIKNLRVVGNYLDKDYYDWTAHLFSQVWESGKYSLAPVSPS